MNSERDLPGIIVTKMTNKVLVESDTDDDPPLYHNESSSDDEKRLLKLKSDIQSKETRCHRILNLLATMTIEPLLFLYMFSFMMHTVCMTNMTMDKLCRNQFNYSKEICSNLSYYEYEKSKIEAISNDYSLYKSLIEFVPGTFVTIFAGSWSDKYGRKPPILLALIGAFLQDIGLLLNAYYFDAPMLYLLLSSIPAGVAGGFACIISLCYSLASETTSERFRTIKYALIELGFGLGMTLGVLAGGILYKYYSYTTVFVVSAVGHGIAIPWLLFAVTETRGQNLRVSWKKKLCDIFSIENLIEGFKACSKKRENKGRGEILVLLMSMCVIILSYVALAEISYIYTFHRYGWSNPKFSAVTTVFGILGILVGLFCVPLFMKVLKMKDPVLGLIGTTSMLAKNLITAFASVPWLYYLANLSGLLSGIAPLAVRARISKLLREDELGKVFSFVAACESLVPVIGTAMVTRMYNATMNTFPGASYLLAGVLLIPAIFTFVWLCFKQPPSNKLNKKIVSVQKYSIKESIPEDDECLS